AYLTAYVIVDAVIENPSMALSILTQTTYTHPAVRPSPRPTPWLCCALFKALRIPDDILENAVVAPPTGKAYHQTKLSVTNSSRDYPTGVALAPRS
ncbi:MAG: hypothetical protein OSB20_10185, partial [Porticoccaceae bacterium]|nr:hypothetical protein [Porticoccaceae bacterium]